MNYKTTICFIFETLVVYVKKKKYEYNNITFLNIYYLKQ